MFSSTLLSPFVFRGFFINVKMTAADNQSIFVSSNWSKYPFLFLKILAFSTAMGIVYILKLYYGSYITTIKTQALILHVSLNNAVEAINRKLLTLKTTDTHKLGIYDKCTYTETFQKNIFLVRPSFITKKKISQFKMLYFLRCAWIVLGPCLNLNL